MTRARIVAPRDDISSSLVTIVVMADDIDNTGCWTFCSETNRLAVSRDLEERARELFPGGPVTYESDRCSTRISLIGKPPHR
jgi:hypothetical protein